MGVPMIDLSSNNHHEGHPIDWVTVHAAGYRAVMIKCTEGLTYQNPYRVEDSQKAKAAGLHVGFYHFAVPRVGEAARQADFAIQSIKGLPRDIGLALDLEQSNGLSWSALDTFGENFLANVAKKAIGSPLYCNPDWLAHLDKAPWGHKLWLASWGKQPHNQVWAWQSGQRLVPGIAGMTDVGVFYG